MLDGDRGTCYRGSDVKVPISSLRRGGEVNLAILEP